MGTQIRTESFVKPRRAPCPAASSASCRAAYMSRSSAAILLGSALITACGSDDFEPELVQQHADLQSAYHIAANVAVYDAAAIPVPAGATICIDDRSDS